MFPRDFFPGDFFPGDFFPSGHFVGTSVACLASFDITAGVDATAETAVATSSSHACLFDGTISASGVDAQPADPSSFAVSCVTAKSAVAAVETGTASDTSVDTLAEFGPTDLVATALAEALEATSASVHAEAGIGGHADLATDIPDSTDAIGSAVGDAGFGSLVTAAPAPASASTSLACVGGSVSLAAAETVRPAGTSATFAVRAASTRAVVHSATSVLPFIPATVGYGTPFAPWSAGFGVTPSTASTGFLSPNAIWSAGFSVAGVGYTRVVVLARVSEVGTTADVDASEVASSTILAAATVATTRSDVGLFSKSSADAGLFSPVAGWIASAGAYAPQMGAGLPIVGWMAGTVSLLNETNVSCYVDFGPTSLESSAFPANPSTSSASAASSLLSTSADSDIFTTIPAPSSANSRSQFLTTSVEHVTASIAQSVSSFASGVTARIDPSATGSALTATSTSLTGRSRTSIQTVVSSLATGLPTDVASAFRATTHGVMTSAQSTTLAPPQSHATSRSKTDPISDRSAATTSTVQPISTSLVSIDGGSVLAADVTDSPATTSSFKVFVAVASFGLTGSCQAVQVPSVTSGVIILQDITTVSDLAIVIPTATDVDSSVQIEDFPFAGRMTATFVDATLFVGSSLLDEISTVGESSTDLATDISVASDSMLDGPSPISSISAAMAPSSDFSGVFTAASRFTGDISTSSAPAIGTSARSKLSSFAVESSLSVLVPAETSSVTEAFTFATSLATFEITEARSSAAVGISGTEDSELTGLFDTGTAQSVEAGASVEMLGELAELWAWTDMAGSSSSRGSALIESMPAIGEFETGTVQGISGSAIADLYGASALASADASPAGSSSSHVAAKFGNILQVATSSVTIPLASSAHFVSAADPVKAVVRGAVGLARTTSATSRSTFDMADRSSVTALQAPFSECVVAMTFGPFEGTSGLQVSIPSETGAGFEVDLSDFLSTGPIQATEAGAVLIHSHSTAGPIGPEASFVAAVPSGCFVEGMISSSDEITGALARTYSGELVVYYNNFTETTYIDPDYPEWVVTEYLLPDFDEETTYPAR